MGVKSSVGKRMVKPDHCAVFDVTGSDVIPSQRSLHFTVGAKRLGRVLENKEVVFVLVGIQRDLLLSTAGGEHVRVRMQVASLSVQMTEADAGTKSNISRNISHGLGIQSGLELRRHEAIAITGVHQTQKVNRKHSAVEADGQQNQAENPSREMFEPTTLTPVSVFSLFSPFHRWDKS